jgi:hypothetical protein
MGRSANGSQEMVPAAIYLTRSPFPVFLERSRFYDMLLVVRQERINQWVWV